MMIGMNRCVRWVRALVLALGLAVAGCGATASGQLDPPAGETNPDVQAVADALKGDPQFLNLVRGDLGPRGPQGPTGPRGVAGPEGPTGANGEKGDPGAAGQPGNDGLSCWDLDGDGNADVSEDVNGDGRHTALDCRGSTGSQGVQGAQGPAGPQGAAGAKGEKGDKGDSGAAGTTDHGQLTGLQDDDHPQYMPVTRNGSEYLVGQRRLVFDANLSGPSVSFTSPSGGSLGTIRFRDNASSTGQLEIDGDSFVVLAARGEVQCHDASASGSWRPIRASSFNVASASALKKQIHRLDRRDAEQLSSMVLSLEPATYLYSDESLAAVEATADSSHRHVPHLGLLAEEVPAELRGWDQGSVDLYALTTALLVTVKELQAQVERQAAEIDEIRRAAP